MKKKIILKLTLISLLVITSIILTACYEERGYAYKNLNNMKLGVHGAYSEDNKLNLSDNSSAEKDDSGTVYDSLNKNLCGTNPHCCGEFTSEEIDFYDLEQRAIVEKNPRLCLDLPDADLVVKCPFEEDYIYYSKKRCLETTANLTSSIT